MDRTYSQSQSQKTTQEVLASDVVEDEHGGMIAVMNESLSSSETIILEVLPVECELSVSNSYLAMRIIPASQS